MNNDFADGWQALKSGDHKTALRIWKPLAEQGDAGAQTVLGGMYANGQGVTKDKGEAIKWYHRSADQRNLYAQHNLGWMYRQGDGVAQDYTKAVAWYRKAAEQGHAKAQFSLGNMYAFGVGVEKNYMDAEGWFILAADQGNEQAKNAVLWVGHKRQVEAMEGFARYQDEQSAELQEFIDDYYSCGDYGETTLGYDYISGLYYDPSQQCPDEMRNRDPNERD